MKNGTRQQERRLSTATILVAVLTLAASLASAQDDRAQDDPVRAPSAARGGVGATTGVSLFVGPPSGQPFQVFTGYDEGAVYTHTRGGAEVTSEALLLSGNGVYHIHLEGVLFVDAEDSTGDPGAAALFHLVLNGDEWVSCSTPAIGNAPRLPAVWQPTPDHDSITSCSVDFTIEVRAESTGGGFAFPSGTMLQAATTPNDLPLGSALALARLEATRVGN